MTLCSHVAAFILKGGLLFICFHGFYFENPDRKSRVVYLSAVTPTVLQILTATMTAPLRPACALLLGLFLALPVFPSCASRFRIPPHEQVARVARFIAHRCDWASMATISSHSPVVGQPFSNVFSVSDGPPGSSSGVPYMYLTHMEISVQDLQVSPKLRVAGA